MQESQNHIRIVHGQHHCAKDHDQTSCDEEFWSEVVVLDNRVIVR